MVFLTCWFTTEKPTVFWMVSLTFLSSLGSYACALATLTAERDWITSVMPASPREIFCDKDALASVGIANAMGIFLEQAKYCS
eukprot:Skav204061  [mRNA]  locus=scaffold3:424553:424801:+ [translate_table: standard]